MDAKESGLLGRVPAGGGIPLYVQSHTARVSKEGERLIVTDEDAAPVAVRLGEISQVVLMGNVTITTPCLHELMRRAIPVSWHGANGWFLGHTVGIDQGAPDLRQAQYAAFADPERALGLARGVVAAKIRCGRERLRRRGLLGRFAVTPPLLARLAAKAERAATPDTLRGLEGTAAALYFKALGASLRPPSVADTKAFRFTVRRRHPPPDPVNALLSFAYALLLRVVTVALSGARLDPMAGFYHVQAPGRPALALDMMEPFRPLLADAAVAALITTGAVSATDFTAAEEGIMLSASARKVLIGAFERRLETEVTVPHLGAALSYRRLIAMQALLLAQYLAGRRADVPHFVPA
ncbi:MAG: CRISPR-associated endonuclease Cas1 [Rhodospirillales bacterium]|nr:CRISPR-associated endonuclease Cas1 [Rhodospirillales bacterium]